MSKYIINGGKKLQGKLVVPSSKNAVLPLLAGSVMCDEKVIIEKIPFISDVCVMLRLLESIGIKCSIYDDTVEIDPTEITGYTLPESLTKEIRSSIFMLGPMLAKTKKAIVPYPGGCNIGLRPIDLHIKGLKALNVKISEEHGYIVCDGQNMKAGQIHLDFPSVGATENIMMCATKLKGKTTIINPAKEPEIIDLQNFLNSMGAKISGAGGNIIEIEGVNYLHSSSYLPIPDRIIAGTYLIGVALTGGEIMLENVRAQHINILLEKLKDINCKVKIFKDDRIYLTAGNKLRSFGEISTGPYPGFPTDLQPQILALATCLKGVSIIEENLFETRYKHVPELRKMGAKIILKDKYAIITGKPTLDGAEVYATDLRAGSCLVLAGLKARGYTTVNDIYHIERGYVDLDKEFNKLGADIKKIEN